MTAEARRGPRRTDGDVRRGPRPSLGARAGASAAAVAWDLGQNAPRELGTEAARDAEQAAEIDRLLRRAAGDPRIVGFAGGLPADISFPRVRLARAFVAAMSRAGAAGLQYGWPEGSPALRAFVAARLAARGAAIGADDVIITSGAQQAIAIALQLIAARGDRVAVDAESYPAALELMRARGLLAVPARFVRATRGACGTAAAPHRDEVGAFACVYAMPAIANPRGTTMTAAGRRALVARGVPVIEDDAYADLSFRGPPPPPLLADAGARDRVFHVGALTATVDGLWLELCLDPATFGPDTAARIIARALEGWLPPESFEN